MVVFESIKDFFEILISPMKTIFGLFPDLEYVITGILFLSLSYLGWRAVK